MSCRSNHGSSAMTSYARAVSGLSDVQTLHLFHRMMNEGRERETPAPTPQAVSNWRRDTINAVSGNANISEGQRERIIQRLEALPADFVPDGPTFHAWNRIRSSAWHARQALNKVYQQLAERGGVEAEYLAARSETYQKTGDAARWRPPARFMERLGREFPDQIDLRLIPQDNRTLYALSRLLEENPASAPVATSSPPSNTVDRPQAEALPDSTSTQETEAQPARCSSCGQFMSGGSHDCPVLALQSNNAELRWQAAITLGNIGGDVAVVALTSAMFQDSYWVVRRNAAVALGNIGNPTAIPALIQALQGDGHEDVRCAAAGALGSIRDPAAVPALIQALNDTGGLVRLEAVQALGMIGDPAAVPELTFALIDSDIAVQRAAVAALRHIEDTETVRASNARPEGEAPTQVEVAAPVQTTRCPTCGQFTGAEGHNCPADVVLRIGRNQNLTLGDLLSNGDGRSYLNWLAASTTSAGGSGDVTSTRNGIITNYSELARQLLAGRAAMAADQAEATVPVSIPTPPSSPAPPPPPTQPAPAPAPRTVRRRWARAANEVRQNLTAQEQAHLLAAQEAQVQEAARPRQEAALAPKLSGPEGQATYDSWVTELKAARAAGSGPPYETEAVLGEAATSFGVELEFKGADADAVARKLYEMGIAGHPQMVGYHHSCPQCQGKWKVERDGSVTNNRSGRNIGGEVVAPVLRDTPEHWQQLKQVADTIKELGGQCDNDTGQHVHISTASYDNQGSKYRNLAMEVAAQEDLLYRLSAPDQAHHRGLLRTDQPEYHYAQPIAPRLQQFLTRPAPALRTLLKAMRVYEMAHDRVPWAHYMSLNMQHVNEADAGKSRVEFRTFNGTIDPVQIQTNVRLAAGLVHTAGQNEVSLPEGRGLGWHRQAHTDEEDSEQIRGLIDRLHFSESGAKAVLDTFLRGRWQYQNRAELQQAS